MATDEEIMHDCDEDEGDEGYLGRGGYKPFSVLWMLKEAREDERKKMIKILDELWDTEATKINSGVYYYPFKAMREMIIKKLDNKVD